MTRDQFGIFQSTNPHKTIGVGTIPTDRNITVNGTLAVEMTLCLHCTVAPGRVRYAKARVLSLRCVPSCSSTERHRRYERPSRPRSPLPSCCGRSLAAATRDQSRGSRAGQWCRVLLRTHDAFITSARAHYCDSSCLLRFIILIRAVNSSVLTCTLRFHSKIGFKRKYIGKMSVDDNTTCSVTLMWALFTSFYTTV